MQIAGLYCPDSALLRHEVAYALGQSQSPAAADDLMRVLSMKNENHMVRHECAEALGAIATDQCYAFLCDYLNDDEVICFLQKYMFECYFLMYKSNSSYIYCTYYIKVKDCIKGFWLNVHFSI